MPASYLVNMLCALVAIASLAGGCFMIGLGIVYTDTYHFCLVYNVMKWHTWLSYTGHHCLLTPTVSYK